MSIFKNSTSPSKISGDSMWFPMEDGDTSKFWSKYHDKPGMGSSQGRKPANPHGSPKMTHKMRHKV